jgi:general secretion pathway protein K
MSARGERGIVLIAVLMAVTIMSLSVLALSAVTRSELASTRLEQRLLTSRYALRSGLELAKAAIIAFTPEERVLLDGEPFVLDIGNGIKAEISIRDAAGLADLNRTDMRLIEALLSDRLSSDDARTLASRIKGLRDAGKPKDAPAAGTNPRKWPLVFRSADQLPHLAADPAMVIAALAGLVTVYNPGSTINPLAAPADVLAAVPGLTPEDIAVISAARTARSWKTNAAFVALLVKHEAFLSIGAPGVFTIGIVLVEGQDVLQGKHASAVLLAGGEAEPAFRTLFASGF